MERWRGKWALVTGASAGIGREMARQLAAGGAHVALTARRRERLEQLAAELRAQHGISTQLFVSDLSDPAAPQAIFDFTRRAGLEVELLVNNAGFGAYGEFHTVPIGRELEVVRVNVDSVLHLTHLFLGPMIERRSGDILIVSSTAAFQGVPYIATYAATKVFELHFGEALAEEVRQFGVRVCVLCPGTTSTEFQRVAGSPSHPARVPETAEKVARVGLRAMARGKTCVISGAQNWLMVESQRLLPRSTLTFLAAKLFQPPK